MKNMWNFPPSHLVMYLQLILMTIKSVNLDKHWWQGERGGRALACSQLELAGKSNTYTVLRQVGQLSGPRGQFSLETVV